MDNKKLWLKISGSITYYLKNFVSDFSREDLWEDYVDYAFEIEDAEYTYLDKQSLEWVKVDAEVMKKAEDAFYERVKKRRINEKPVVKKEKVLAKVIQFPQKRG